MPTKQSRDLVGDEVHHLHSQHGAIDEEMPTLVENRVLPVQRVRSLIEPYVSERRASGRVVTKHGVGTIDKSQIGLGTQDSVQHVRGLNKPYVSEAYLSETINSIKAWREHFQNYVNGISCWSAQA